MNVEIVGGFRGLCSEIVYLNFGLFASDLICFVYLGAYIENIHGLFLISWLSIARGCIKAIWV